MALPDAVVSLWRGRWWVLGAIILSAVLGAAYSLQAVSWYRAQTTLLPVDARGTALGGQLSQLGGLASLAGVGVGVGSDRAEPLGVLRSRDFTGAFITQKNLLPVLFADRWDASRSAWKADGPDVPDLRDGTDKFLKDILRVDEDRKAGLVVVAVEWTNAQQAAEWANELVLRLNAQLRTRAQADALASITFLQSELDAPGQVSLKQATSRLLESELEKLMVARGREEFSFRVLDRAEPPKKRLRPQRTLIVIASAVAGLFAGMVMVLIVDQWGIGRRRVRTAP